MDIGRIVSVVESEPIGDEDLHLEITYTVPMKPEYITVEISEDPVSEPVPA